MRTYLIEIGMGSDLHHPEPTKCAVRAVQDAITRCSMVPSPVKNEAKITG